MGDSEQPVDLRTDVPHGARIWNYWLGGKDNYAADRAVADIARDAFPEIALMAVRSREFLVRAVTFLAAEAGVRQFIDVGTGLPTMQNTHEVAQRVAPDSTIVYVDNDPLVLAHARALLGNTTAEGVTTYVDADYHDPERILAQARQVLDFEQPIAVMFMGVFGYEPDTDVVTSIVRTLTDATPAGSYMVLWDGTSTSPGVIAGAKAQAEAGSPYQLRTVEEIRTWFGVHEPVEPGIVPVSHWRPEPGSEPEDIDAYGGVAIKR